jgi:UDP:flavonoid glycosyltransferase YjiC (YdhE family)
MADPVKPLILMSSTPIYGHFMPMRAIAKALLARGYEITFVCASKYQKDMEKSGFEYFALEGSADFTEDELETRFKERNNIPPGPLQMAWDIENCFIEPIPDQYATIQRALRSIEQKYPNRPVIHITEGVFQGALPAARGARGIKPAGLIGIGIIPMCLGSVDCAPFGPGILPDSSPEGRIRNIAMTREINQTMFAKGQKDWDTIFESLGAIEAKGTPWMDALYLFPDRFLQMCIPSVEYQRSDAPSNIRFTGGLPKGSRDPMTDAPSWWGEVIENKDKKDIIFVCQGTVALDYHDLTIPTLEALKDRDNTLVVVALGKKGFTLPEGTHIPANARVADFIPFDEVLPHTSVFVTNGGYGGFQHGILNGTPLVIAGAGEDKPEVAARGEWAGVAINLRTGSPTKEQIRVAVDEIITNPKYKVRAQELEAEMAEFDPVGVIIQNIEELTTGKHLN